MIVYPLNLELYIEPFGWTIGGEGSTFRVDPIELNIRIRSANLPKVILLPSEISTAVTLSASEVTTLFELESSDNSFVVSLPASEMVAEVY